MDKPGEKGLTYRNSGVDQEKEDLAMKRFSAWVRKTFSLNPDSEVLLDLGFFANVVDIGIGPCIAIASDSVGTKIMIAKMMRKFDTIAIDCMAMNVNDIICVGASPVSFVDYLAVTEVDEHVIDQIGRGLYRAAELAEVSIPGGELAQVGELLAGGEEGSGFDIGGTCIGTVRKEDIILGEGISEGDAVIGVLSQGLHSNGYTLARKALFDMAGFRHDQYRDELGETIGEALLRPTPIYSQPILHLLKSDVPVKGLANITGGGLFNLTRFASPMGFVLDTLPEPPPIFQLIQEVGKVDIAEMYTVFNMGIGFCIIIPDDAKTVAAALGLLEQNGLQGKLLGRAAKLAEKGIVLPQRSLVSRQGRLVRDDTASPPPGRAGQPVKP